MQRYLSLLAQQGMEWRDGDWINSKGIVSAVFVDFGLLTGGSIERHLSILRVASTPGEAFSVATNCDCLDCVATSTYVGCGSAFDVHRLGRLHRIRTLCSTRTGLCTTVCRIPSN